MERRVVGARELKTRLGTPRHRLRAGDAMQLASCLYLQREMSQPLPFVAFEFTRRASRVWLALH